MLFERFEEKGLGHYSYAIGCQKKGAIAIIDPRCDLEHYLEYAEKHRLVISHVFETHIHEDYVSGARELAKRLRASLCLSGYSRGEKYQISFPHHACFEGDIFCLGSIQLKVLHTPGHSPEHISLLVYDLKKSFETPIALFSGDFLLMGTIGRIDILGEKNIVTSAKMLYESIQKKLKYLPDELNIFSAHSADSFCHLGISRRLFSTLGFEKLSNPFLNPGLLEEDFVNQLIHRDFSIPFYYQKMKQYNSCSNCLEILMPIPLDLIEFKKQVDRGATVIDLRDQKAFGKGHIPKAISIGAGIKVGFWAANSVPYNHSIVLVTDEPTRLKEIIYSLSRVGFNQVEGYLQGGFDTWKAAGFSISSVDQVTPKEVSRKIHADSDFQIIDVRTDTEWNIGHILGSHHISCLKLSGKIKELFPKKLIFVCAGGYRSIWAASLAKREGYDLIGHIVGGIYAWQRSGFKLSF